MPTAQDILKQYFGYDSFRPGQDKLVQSILSGRDTLEMCIRDRHHLYRRQ